MGRYVAEGIKSIQRGVISVGGTSATATITAVNVNKSILFHLGEKSGVTIAYSRLYIGVKLGLTNSTTITAEVYDSDCDAIVSFQIVEYY